MLKLNIPQTQNLKGKSISISLMNKSKSQLNLAKIDVNSSKFISYITKGILDKTPNVTNKDLSSTSKSKIGFKHLKKNASTAELKKPKSSLSLSISSNNYSLIRKDPPKSERTLKSAYKLEISPNRIDSDRLSKIIKKDNSILVLKKRIVDENTPLKYLNPSLNLKQSAKTSIKKPQATHNFDELPLKSSALKISSPQLYDSKQLEGQSLYDISDKFGCKNNEEWTNYHYDENKIDEKINKEMNKIIELMKKKEINPPPLPIEIKPPSLPIEKTIYYTALNTEQTENSFMNNFIINSDIKLKEKMENDKNPTTIPYDTSEYKDRHSIRIMPFKFCSLDLIGCNELQSSKILELSSQNHLIKSNSQPYHHYMGKKNENNHPDKSINLSHLSIPSERRDQSPPDRINFKLNNDRSNSNLFSETNGKSFFSQRKHANHLKEYLSFTSNKYTKYTTDINEQNKTPFLEINVNVAAVETPIVSDYLTLKLPEIIDFFNPSSAKQFESQNIFNRAQQQNFNDNMTQTYTLDASILSQTSKTVNQDSLSHIALSTIIPASITRKMYCFPNWEQRDAVDKAIVIEEAGSANSHDKYLNELNARVEAALFKSNTLKNYVTLNMEHTPNQVVLTTESVSSEL